LAQHPGSAARSGAANATQDLQIGDDAKEKAEDAALLQQLESGSPRASTETKVKNQFNSDKAQRFGGGWVAGPGPTVAPLRLKNRQVSGARTLLVRTTVPEPKDQAAMEEDLAIMSRVMAKAVEETPGRPGHPGKVMGIDVFFTPGGSQLRSLYVENYGALFFLNVNFPLVAPPEKRTEAKPAGDSPWEDARQELYGQRSQENGGEPAEDYSEEKVDRLKETLLEALKNGTNMRGLRPNDFVTLWISGASAVSGSFRVVRTGTSANPAGKELNLEQLASSSKRTVLTIRVTKAEIDKFAQGKLTAEDFRKQAQMTAYTSDAAGSAGDSLILDYGRAKF